MIPILLVLPNREHPSGLPTEGFRCFVDVVPRQGEEVLFASENENRRLVVANVRHVLFPNYADSTAGGQALELTLRDAE